MPQTSLKIMLKNVFFIKAPGLLFPIRTFRYMERHMPTCEEAGELEELELLFFLLSLCISLPWSEKKYFDTGIERSIWITMAVASPLQQQLLLLCSSSYSRVLI